MVVLQYPMMSVKPLQDIIYYKNQVVFAGCEEPFKKAVQADGLGEYFKDDVGHLTTVGAELLAQNLSKNIFSL